MNKPLRVLLVEDSEVDADLLMRFLQKSGYQTSCRRVDAADQLAAALQSAAWDIVLCDWRMPGFDALQALEQIKTSGQELPFIIVSGTIGEDSAVEAMRAGAHDYVMKSHLARLAPAIERELREAELRRERQRMQAKNFHLAAIVDSSEDAIISITLDGNVLSWNKGAEHLHGYPAPEVLGRSISIVVPPVCYAELPDIFQRVGRGEFIERFETVRVSKDGTLLDVSLTISPVRNDADQVVGASIIARDITAKKREEAERQQMIEELNEALTHVKTLTGLLPICAGCKKIRDKQGEWEHIENYVKARSNAEFTHSICPDCVERLYPELAQMKKPVVDNIVDQSAVREKR